MIREIFHFNDAVINIGQRELNPLTQKEAEWTLKAWAEEADEFRDAFEKQDMVKMVDSALDITYFAIGTLRRMGLNEAQAMACFMAIHLANMTKKKGALATRGDFADDAVKPAEFVPPDIRIAEILGLTGEAA